MQNFPVSSPVCNKRGVISCDRILGACWTHHLASEASVLVDAVLTMSPRKGGWGPGSKGDRSRLCLFPQAIEARPCRLVLPVEHQSPNCRCMKGYASACEVVWKCNVENVHRRGRKSRDPLETNTRPSKSGESSGVWSNLPSALPRNSAARSRRGDGQTCRGRVSSAACISSERVQA